MSAEKQDFDVHHNGVDDEAKQGEEEHDDEMIVGQ